MKRIFANYTFGCLLLITTSFQACNNYDSIAERVFVDSLGRYYTPDFLLTSNQRNMDFWFGKMQKSPAGNINEMQYAAALVNRFKLSGHIQDLDSADYILRKVDTTFAHSLAAPLMSLVSVSIMHHRFAEADSFYQKACKIGIKAYQKNALGFDIAFELGNYGQASILLKSMSGTKDYNYCFRRSKFDHLNGKMDSALSAMQQAISLAGKSPYLQNLAWSMLGDLEVHQNNLTAAATDLKQAIRLNPGDMHAILQLAWVTLVQHNDTTNAKALFEIAKNRNALPDPYYKLYQMAQWQKDSQKALFYARLFEQKSTMPEYGSMYSKYLIELHATILDRPQQAENLAFAELKNRATPQTYAWYAYSLLCNHQKEKAYQIFEQYIAGQPIEGIELYYVGKILKSRNHGLDAQKCFESALQNKYDLSPYMISDMVQLMK